MAKAAPSAGPPDMIAAKMALIFISAVTLVTVRGLSVPVWSPLQPVNSLPAFGNGFYRRAVCTMIYRLRRGAREGAAGARGEGHCIGVAGEIRGDIHIRRHVGDGQGVVRARLVAAPARELIARIRNGFYRRAVCTMIYRLRRGAREGAAGARGEGSRYGCCW